uniref:type II toxin-antitoxin system TacA family antitoxin n=1 Tax=Pseudomonas fluorescens TaxID=294 RepID=UPI00130E679E|nr:DUF1778 domain-containing protein [Pseudomonas fluorescens]
MPIHIRTDTKRRDLIDTAEQLLSVDRTSFILCAACKPTEHVILDQRLFLLSDGAFDQFEQALEVNAIKNNKCVKSLLSRPKPWS